MTRGTVTWADAAKGYGFIAPDGDEGDVFVSRCDMSARSPALKAGARVDFEERVGARGRRAVAKVTVKRQSSPPTAQAPAASEPANKGTPQKPESPSSAEESAQDAAEWEGMPPVPEPPSDGESALRTGTTSTTTGGS